MKEKLQTSVPVPVWAITTVISLFLTVSIFVINLSVKAGQASATIQDCKSKIENKVDVERFNKDIDRIYQSLNRIENKIDLIQK